MSSKKTWLIVSAGVAAVAGLVLLIWFVARAASPPQVAAGPTATAGTPTPTGSPTAGPTSTAGPVGPEPQIIELPDAIMLSAEDIATGTAVNDLVEGDWRMEFLTQVCSKWTPRQYTGQQSTMVGGRERALSSPSLNVVQGVGFGGVPSMVWEMEETRRFLTQCATFSFEGKTYGLQTVAADFNGDESFLVKLEIQGDTPKHYAYIREGEVVTQIFFDGSPSIDEMMRVANSAAGRLCVLATTC